LNRLADPNTPAITGGAGSTDLLDRFDLRL